MGRKRKGDDTQPKKRDKCIAQYLDIYKRHTVQNSLKRERN